MSEKKELLVWLIRHGESTANKGEWHADPRQSVLTPKGEEEAKHAAAQITTRPDLIIVSPTARAQASALPIRQKWPDVPVEIWPIEEIIYLSPSKYQDQSLASRKTAIERYWQAADPYFREEQDAESFADFIQRLEAFRARLLTHQGFLVIVGHGQFFKAFQLGLKYGFASTAEWMKKFRAQETGAPITNGEIIKTTLKF
jgi:broad specificity phosphatase PhoE